MDTIEVNGQRFTNRYSIAKEVVNVILKDRYTVEGEEPSDYSVSQLINPIQQTIIKKFHKDNLVIFDVSSQFFSFMGSVAHQVLEDALEDNGAMAEKRLYATFHGKTISGKMDHYHEGVVRDYKTTKAYNLQKGDHKSWELQQNCYAGLLREHNYPVEKLTITCLVFDWKKGDAYKTNYPQAPVVDLRLPLWAQEDQLSYMSLKVKDLVVAENFKDDLSTLYKAFPCTDEEMWSRVKDYAIIKPDAGRAYKTFPTEEEARAHYREMKKKEDYRIEKRMDARTRCFEHCPAAKVCKQHIALCAKEGVPHTYPNHDIDIVPLF